ncbi:sodium-coupled monocarboxylate transporter 2 [Pyxicephalus adspersus]|uniref:sodium-coupled monocarboxylate transporter 2 n=1 Tax=Pyxicephalus adspersus TaxID=30357 RepID=UPI003B5BD64C
MTMFEKPVINNFAVWDYVVFAALLVISASIGVFFAIKERKKKTSNEFLIGGRQMTCGPVALSLTASFMSAITVLGTPSEVVRYGAYYLFFIISYTFVITISAELFVPVFYRSGITSTYEYLELRFSRPVRYFATIMYILQTILYTGVVVYAPALALNQVATTIISSLTTSSHKFVGKQIITVPTTGGLKAVVWTDAFQMVVMVVGFLSVLVEGTIQNGGPSNIWQTAMNGSRLDIVDFSVDPLRRHTFWTIAVGGTFTWLGIYGVNQSTIQRCISCKSEKHAKLALYLNLVGLWVILVCAVFSGLVMYAHYEGCDPWTAGFINAPDQMMPYFVMHLFSKMPGLPGLFVACAFSGTLSTVAASINALATVTYEDIVKNIFKNISDKKSTWISKGLCVLFGALCTGMAVVASFMGGVVQAALSIHGMCGGPMLGLFSLGILFPWTNWKGALGGVLTGFVMSFWVAIGAFIYPAPDSKTLPLTLRTDECILQNITANATMSTPLVTTLSATTAPERSVLADNWYSISYLYYSAVGYIACVIMGLLISFITGPQRGKNVKPLLIRPVCNLICFWSDKYKKKCWCGVPHDEIDEELDHNGLKKDITMNPMTDKPEEHKYENDSCRKPPPGYNEEEKSYTNLSADKESRM